MPQGFSETEARIEDDTVTIDTGDDPGARLEIRRVVLPDGRERELYVVTAARVTVTSGELTIVASRLEFDPLEERVLVVGPGRVERPDGEPLQGAVVTAASVAAAPPPDRASWNH